MPVYFYETRPEKIQAIKVNLDDLDNLNEIKEWLGEEFGVCRETSEGVKYISIVLKNKNNILFAYNNNYIVKKVTSEQKYFIYTECEFKKLFV